ncbi:MAG: acyl-homoserine-lactone synthase [Pseudomonadota bacterium]
MYIFGFRIAEPDFSEIDPDSTLVSFYRVRKAVFIDGLKWNLDHKNGLEIDQFDNEQAYYSLVLRRNQIAMAARGHKINTEDPDSALIQYLFLDYPELETPISSNDWDVTRLCINPSLKLNGLSKAIGFIALFFLQKTKARSLECQRMIAVSHPKISKHFSRIGIKTNQISQTVTIRETGSKMAVFEFPL